MLVDRFASPPPMSIALHAAEYLRIYDELGGMAAAAGAFPKTATPVTPTRATREG